MFDSIIAIFEQYLDGTTRYNVYSINAQRGDNPEDTYYLCHINKGWYVVYETDYIGPLSYVFKEVAPLFSTFDARPLKWLVKKEEHEKLHRTSFNLEISDDDKQLREALIFSPSDSYLRYAVLEVEVEAMDDIQHNPNTYGHRS